jgi:hypothetical protein
MRVLRPGPVRHAGRPIAHGLRPAVAICHILQPSFAESLSHLAFLQAEKDSATVPSSHQLYPGTNARHAPTGS